MSPQTSRWVWIAVLLGAVVVLPVAAQSVRTGDTEEVPRASGVEVGDRALPTDRNANDAVPKGDLLDFLAAAGSDDGKPTEEPANKGGASKSLLFPADAEAQQLDRMKAIHPGPTNSFGGYRREARTFDSRPVGTADGGVDARLSGSNSATGWHDLETRSTSI